MKQRETAVMYVVTSCAEGKQYYCGRCSNEFELRLSKRKRDARLFSSYEHAKHAAGTLAGIRPGHWLVEAAPVVFIGIEEVGTE